MCLTGLRGVLEMTAAFKRSGKFKKKAPRQPNDDLCRVLFIKTMDDTLTRHETGRSCSGRTRSSTSAEVMATTNTIGSVIKATFGIHAYFYFLTFIKKLEKTFISLWFIFYGIMYLLIISIRPICTNSTSRERSSPAL